MAMFVAPDDTAEDFLTASVLEDRRQVGTLFIRHQLFVPLPPDRQIALSFPQRQLHPKLQDHKTVSPTSGDAPNMHLSPAGPFTAPM